MPVTKPTLSVEQLALLFTQLKRFENSGLSAVQAFTFLAKSEDKLNKPLAIMLHQLNAGRPLSEAGFRVGLFNETHKTLIEAGEAGGKLAEVYGQLANYYTGLSSRLKKIKSRLYFSALILIIALFVQPLPAFVSSEISGFGYLQLSLGRLLIIVLGFMLLVKLPTILSTFGFEKAWHRLQLRTPVVANWVIKRQRNDFLFILAMLLESGVAFAIALPKAVATIKNSCLREKFASALSLCATGASVTDTLAKVPIINAALLQIINSSEQSGKLASGILHFAWLEAETISLQDDALAEWLPRLIYVLIAIWMGQSILASKFSTVVPDTL